VTLRLTPVATALLLAAASPPLAQSMAAPEDATDEDTEDDDRESDGCGCFLMGAAFATLTVWMGWCQPQNWGR
jgi:hypothetical protein